MRINRKNHPWVDIDDTQLLQSAQLYQADPDRGEFGVTLGGVMLFGTDSQILQVCPAHRTDQGQSSHSAERLPGGAVQQLTYPRTHIPGSPRKSRFLNLMGSRTRYNAAAVLICKLEFWILEHGIGSDEHLAHDSNQCHFLWFVVILD